MTEGIIQKEFKTMYEDIQYYKEHDCEVKPEAVLDDLQHRIIITIKQHKFDTDKYFDDTIKEWLIGGHQELECKHENKRFIDNPFGSLYECSECGELIKP